MSRLGAKMLPLLALSCGVLGFVFSSTVLVVAAILLAGYVVVNGVASLSGPNLWRTRRRRHR